MTGAFDWSTFEARIQNSELRVAVIGLGYIGLPLALTFVERSRLRITGFDIDASKTRQLSQGSSYIAHLGAARVRAALDSGRFSASADFDALDQPDAILIAVPTPLTRQREPDLSYVTETARSIARRLRPGQLIVLESTTYPGTTASVVTPILETSDLRNDRDFLVAYSPEREDPGSRSHTTATIPKLVGGVTPRATELAAALYRTAIEQVIPVANAAEAEAAKLTENVFRAVNIALVNELKIIYEKMGIDIWSVLDAASTKPFGFMRFNPGPGLGGHCIPLDPFYLSWKAREFGVTTRFIELAGEVNRSMPSYVVERVSAALNLRGKALRASRILILGVAYKPDVDDLRESPAFEIITQFKQAEADVSYHDPHIAVTPKLRSWPDLPPMHSVELSAERLQSSDVVLLVTNHRAVDYDFVLEHAPLIVDTRGTYRQPNPKVIKA